MNKQIITHHLRRAWTKWALPVIGFALMLALVPILGLILHALVKLFNFGWSLI
jgi:hypothetical protein